MLTTNTNINTNLSVNVTGESIVDDEVVARYSAHVEPDEDRIAITTVIYDKDKYKADCQDDESEFEEAVYESEQKIMDKQEEILGLFKEDEPEDEPEDEQEEPDDESGDESGDDDDKTGAGNEETIIP